MQVARHFCGLKLTVPELRHGPSNLRHENPCYHFVIGKFKKCALRHGIVQFFAAQVPS